MMLWSSGDMEQWSCGVMELRSYGAMESRSCEAMEGFSYGDSLCRRSMLFLKVSLLHGPRGITRVRNGRCPIVSGSL